MARPGIVAHADWSCSPSGRALIVARRTGTGTYALRSVDPGEPTSLLQRLSGAAAGSVIVGFDLPLGLPQRYAEQRGIDRFDKFVLGLDHDAPLFAPATAAELSLERPFYPARPGGASRRF